jgi:hypothetical protein
LGEELSLFRPEFNGSIRVESRPERLTCEAGAVLLREAIERLGVVRFLRERMLDTRNQSLITHPLDELLNTSLLMLAQGWRDQDDADALRDDAAFRLAVSTRKGISPLEMRGAKERERNRNPEVPDGLPSQPTLSRAVGMLASEENRDALRLGILEASVRRIRATRRGHRMRELTVDVDSLPVEVHGHQPFSEHNGHYHARVYHPLIASVAETGDMLDAWLRPGNVHTADGALEFILGLLDRVERDLCQIAAVRMDAGFPGEELLSALEDRRTPYVARVKNNPVLDRMAADYLRRPVGRPPAEPRTWLHELTYQAKSWSKPRRVVLVVLERPSELFLHHFWLITNWTPEQQGAAALLEMYRERGTAEGHMGELMSVLQPALSSSPRTRSHYRGRALEERPASEDSFERNEVLLLLNVLAYNVMHATRTLLETATGEGWSLKRLRERVLRVPARILVHARRAILVIGTGPARLWQKLWSRLVRIELVADTS